MGCFDIPQSCLPSGGQVGIGIKPECMEEEAIVRAEADDVWVEATAPVRARTTTKARTMFFILLLLWEDAELVERLFWTLLLK